MKNACCLKKTDIISYCKWATDLIQLEFWDVNQSKCIRLSLDFVSCAMVTITSTCIKMTKNILTQLSSFYFQHYFSCQYNQWEILRHFLCFALKNHYKLHFIKLFFGSSIMLSVRSLAVIETLLKLYKIDLFCLNLWRDWI